MSTSASMLISSSVPSSASAVETSTSSKVGSSSSVPSSIVTNLPSNEASSATPLPGNKHIVPTSSPLPPGFPSSFTPSCSSSSSSSHQAQHEPEEPEPGEVSVSLASTGISSTSSSSSSSSSFGTESSSSSSIALIGGREIARNENVFGFEVFNLKTDDNDLIAFYREIQEGGGKDMEKSIRARPEEYHSEYVRNKCMAILEMYMEAAKGPNVFMLRYGSEGRRADIRIGASYVRSPIYVVSFPIQDEPGENTYFIRGKYFIPTYQHVQHSMITITSGKVCILQEEDGPEVKQPDGTMAPGRSLSSDGTARYRILFEQPSLHAAYCKLQGIRTETFRPFPIQPTLDPIKIVYVQRKRYTLALKKTSST